jgi:hypothetical protein
MKSQSAQPRPLHIQNPAELYRALDWVIDLAKGNCLDLADPDMAEDPALLEQAHSQRAAIKTVMGLLSQLEGACSLNAHQPQPQLQPQRDRAVVLT